jgi:hypothetical protein
MSAPLELVREAYTLLVYKYPDGLTREQLAAKLQTKDRSARDAVNACRYLAATKPLADGSVWIIGFDPQIERYVAARDVHQARRVIAYQESRVLDINRGLEAQKRAYQQTFGSDYRASEQEVLF